MPEAIEELIGEVSAKFEEFKGKNDQRIESLETKSSDMVKLSDQVDKLNEQISDLEAIKGRLESVETKGNRPGSTTAEEEAYAKAFDQFVRKGDSSELETKSVNTGADADGGFAVPEEIDRNMLELLKDMSPMRQVCNVISVGTSDYKRLVNLGGAGSGWVGEEAARPATGTPTLAQIAAVMGEIYANPQATQASLDDILFNAETWLGNEVSKEFAEKEGAAFLLGDGVNKPKGILAAPMALTADSTRPFKTIQNMKSGAAGDFDADDLINLIYTLKAGYRQNGRFMMNGMTLAKVRKMKDGQGNYLWQPGLQLGQPSTLLNYGVAENEDMPDVAADAHAVMFGDFKRAYTIVDRMGTRVLRDPYTNKPYVGFYTTKRVGGMLEDSQAIKVLTLSV